MEFPLYMTIEQSSKFSGVGQNTLRAWLDSRDPMPYLQIGRKRLIQRDALPAYLERKQEVKP